MNSIQELPWNCKQRKHTVDSKGSELKAGGEAIHF